MPWSQNSRMKSNALTVHHGELEEVENEHGVSLSEGKVR